MSSMRIAIISPNENAYSESFIQAHRNLLEGDVFFLYGGYYPRFYEGKLLPQSAPPPPPTLSRRVWNAFKHRVVGTPRPIPTPLPDPFEKFLLDNKIDVVLAEYGPTGANILNSCKRLNRPLIVNFFGYDASIYNVIDKNREAYIDLGEYAYRLTGVSQSICDFLERIGIPENKVLLNPPGVDMRLFNSSLENSTELYFLAIGRFVAKKAPYKTLFAFAKAQKVIDDAKLIFIGDGDLLDVCKDLVFMLGIEDRVTFAGIKPHNELVRYMEDAIAFVQHSIRAPNGDMEGTPVAILEAMAAGLPVISTRHAGIPDVVVEGETGLLCDEGDVDTMADYMIQLARDKSKAHEMGQKGRTRIQEHFTLERHISKLQSILEEAATNA